jgi:hypothetical protein
MLRTARISLLALALAGCGAESAAPRQVRVTDDGRPAGSAEDPSGATRPPRAIATH